MPVGAEPPGTKSFDGVLPPAEPGWKIRPGRDTDGPALIALIWSCWSAYPGIRMNVDAEMPEMHTLASDYEGQGGALWVAKAGRRTIGMIATRPVQDYAWEICRVYVDPARHGVGLGAALLVVAERHAVSAGAKRLVLWSDTRFDRAHRFYEKHSYVRSGGIRALLDLSNSLEFGYAKPVGGIESLDVAAAASAVQRLVTILTACVDAGALIPFLRPLDLEKARVFWERAGLDVGTGKRTILGVWRGGVLIGTGVLDLAMPETQAYCATVQMILIAPEARGWGLGRRLLRELERAAVSRGRFLLTMQVGAWDAADALCRSEGWGDAGHIPGFGLGSDGRPRNVAIRWKRLPSQG